MTKIELAKSYMKCHEKSPKIMKSCMQNLAKNHQKSSHWDHQ